jgi:hypothetical protein
LARFGDVDLLRTALLCLFGGLYEGIRAVFQPPFGNMN